MKKQLLTGLAMIVSIAAFSQMQDSSVIQDEIQHGVKTVGNIVEGAGVPSYVTAIVSSVASLVGAFFIHKAIVKRKKRNEEG